MGGVVVLSGLDAGLPNIFQNVLLAGYYGKLWECKDEYNPGSLRTCDGICQRGK